GRGCSAPHVSRQASSSMASGTFQQPTDMQYSYAQVLRQTWRKHKDSCLQKVDYLREAIAHLEANSLSRAVQTEAYRIAHTLSGTLGTFGLSDAMHLTRQIEQELHPDIYVEPTQSESLHRHTAALKQAIRMAQIEEIAGYSTGQPTARPVASDPNPTRLMLLDDDHIFLKTILGQLQGYGFNVSVLDDPQQFWVVLNNVMPEVLILDIQMPHCSGIELCETLRLAPKWQKLPVMFLSILGDAETQHRAYAVGADDYLAKPITAQHLSDRIRQRLHRIQTISS
ncbi:MAG: response regulator, partial [Elainellaceae cyanobacterium]